MQDPTMIGDGPLREEAAEIVDEAGSRSDYADLLPPDVPLHDPAAVCGR